jgi:hypothetical protein
MISTAFRASSSRAVTFRDFGYLSGGNLMLRAGERVKNVLKCGCCPFSTGGLVGLLSQFAEK